MAPDNPSPQWGIHGKHPAFGDFLTAGLCPSADKHLVSWLGTALSSVRETLGSRWETSWDRAPIIRFWIGGGVWGGAALCGVMAPSRDKVGRRYPLMLVTPTNAFAPTIDPDQMHYSEAEAQVQAFAIDADALRAAMVARAAPDAVADADPVEFWAANPALSSADLLADLGATDFQRGTQVRSYWWTERTPDRDSAVAAVHHLPGAEALAWLIAGLPADADTNALARQEVADARG